MHFITTIGERLRMRLLLFGYEHHAVTTAIAWIRSIADDSTVIRVEFPRYSATLRFAFPLKARDLPHRVTSAAPTFIVRPSGRPLESGWKHVFQSDIDVIEKRIREPNAASPFRWGLTNNDRIHTIQHARTTMRDVLATSVSINRVVPVRFLLFADVNVAIWIDGSLRGSHIVEGKSMRDGLTDAARHAFTDSRFKPITAEELERARIQIGILHPLRMPLSRHERRRNRIRAEKGYSLTRGNAKGFFLPEVHNVRRFKALDDFLAALADEKAGVSAARTKEVRVFEVEDFIEGEKGSAPLSLCGPMLAERTVSTDDRFRLAADWLLAIQGPDGFLPGLVSPLTQRSTLDWPRLAMSAWALAEYGESTGTSLYRAAAERSHTFLRAYIFDQLRTIPHHALTLAYFGRLSLTLVKTANAHRAAAAVIARRAGLAADPILAAQCAGFLRKIGISDGGIADELEKKLRADFRSARDSGRSMSLAAFAELAPLFRGHDPSFADEVSKWLISQQKANGAFPNLTDDDFTYTRGTGKIFEALARSGADRVAIERSLAWLFSMHYTQDNMFFIPSDMQPNLLGGLRHDDFNTDAWIDAVGHLLLGAAALRA